jgi:S-adenosylmethionine-diacylgycerolhomoserine-N-methlytransferase
VDTPGNHAALMDSVYRYQRYIYDFTRKYYLLGRDRLIAELSPAPGALVVEVGCGTARNLIRMARRYPNVRLFGLDASEAMLETAAKAVARAGLAGRVRLAHGYAEALAPAMFGETQAFDEIVFSYSLSMIPDWRGALVAAAGVLSGDGRIHIVDFGDLAGLPGPAKALLLAWLRLFHVAPRTELIAILKESAGRCARFRPIFGGYAFLMACRGQALPNLSNPVAPGSQAFGKSGVTSP